MPEIFSNTTLTVNQLIEKIDTGELGLPELQRPFIWKDSKVRDLFDSMMRGYPIGYLMLWECPSLDKKKSIGVDAHSYDTPKEVIIDGQQRLTSLYAVMKGKKVINSKSSRPFISPFKAVVSPREKRLSMSDSSFICTMLSMACCSNSLYFSIFRPSFVSLLKTLQSWRS